jgi:hypothetical protein
MPDGPGEGQPAQVVRNDEGGTKRVWKLATRSQAPSGRAPRRPSPEERRGRSSGPHRRSRRASALRVRYGSRRSTDGRTHGPIRTGSRRRDGVVAPLGEQPRRRVGRSRTGPDAMGRCRPPGAPRGSPSPDGRTDGTSPWMIQDLGPGSEAGTRCTGDVPSTGLRPQVACRTAAHRPFPRGRTLPARRTVFYGNRFVGGRAGTGTRTTESPRHRGVAFGRQVGTRQCVGRMDGLGIWLREVNSPGWVRWRGDEPHGRAPGSDRSASTGPRAGRFRDSVPEGRFKAMRGADPTIYPVGATVGGNTPGSRHAKDEGGAVKPNERLSPTVRDSEGQDNFREGSRSADGIGARGHLGVLAVRPRPRSRRSNIAFSP